MICTKMGVINLTPNSFSDGNPSQNDLDIEKKINELSHWAHTIDFGAESTAPFNQAISADEEKARFENLLFPYLSKAQEIKFKISLDTYRLSTFAFVYKEIKRHFSDVEVIWNDISGKWDDEVEKYLKDYKEKYVFCHNLAPKRELSSSHMKYLDESSLEKFLENLINFFSVATSYKERVILDPCFGFSKTREQNLYLLKHIEKVLKAYPDHHFLYGISRKSFLRFKEVMDSKNKNDQEFLDRIQSQVITQTISKEFFERLTFRVHSPISLESIEACQTLLDYP